MRRGSIQNGQRGRDSEYQSRRNRGGHRSSQTIKHRTTRCRADRAAPANSVGIGEAAGAKKVTLLRLKETVFGKKSEKMKREKDEKGESKDGPGSGVQEGGKGDGSQRPK